MKSKQLTPHWLPCPICNKRTEVKVYANTALFNFPLQCQCCQKETIINVFQLKMETVAKQD